VAYDDALSLYQHAETLPNLEINDNIPQELYEAIAQVLIFITKLDKK